MKFFHRSRREYPGIQVTYIPVARDESRREVTQRILACPVCGATLEIRSVHHSWQPPKQGPYYEYLCTGCGRTIEVEEQRWIPAVATPSPVDAISSGGVLGSPAF